MLSYIRLTIAGGTQLFCANHKLAEVFVKAAKMTFTNATTPQNPKGSVSAADEIAKFAELHKQGILSDEEFAATKARILD